jgi:predicted DNA-binding protein with PD1-like motif
MRQLSFRLNPGDLLKESVEKIVKEHGIKSGVVLSAVGALDHAAIRLAGKSSKSLVVAQWPGPFEIVSVTGTLSPDGCHLHAALGDADGVVHGGHIMPGCVVGFTCELVLLAFDDVAFSRAMNEATGFPELGVSATL